jgi:predicted nucleic acid-binding protein
MTKPSRQILLLSGASVLIAALATAGYFSYRNIQSQHASTLQELEQLGYPGGAQPGDIEPNPAPTSEQLKARLQGSNPTPVQQLIYNLTQEKEQLAQVNQTLQAQLEAAQVQIDSLQKYQRLNEYFAPKNFEQKITQVEDDLKSYLRKLPEADRFSDLQIDIMAIASAQEYRRFAQQNRLMLDQAEHDHIINDYLPGYAFCTGDAAELAANNALEERMLAQYLRTNDTSLLSTALRQDLLVVIKPCQLALRQSLDTLL